MLKEFCDCCGKEIDIKHTLDNKVICNSCFSKIKRCLSSDSEKKAQIEIDYLKSEVNNLTDELNLCRESEIRRFSYEESAMGFIKAFNEYIDTVQHAMNGWTTKSTIQFPLFGSFTVKRDEEDIEDYSKMLDSFKIKFNVFDERYSDYLQNYHRKIEQLLGVMK